MFQIFEVKVPIVKDLELLTNFKMFGLKILIPILLVFIIAGIIGYERQNAGKAAGLSAHILVALSATGIAIINRLIFDWQIELEIIGIGARPEGQRLIAQVIAGVGFIGAGVILKDRDNVVQGLTTASTIWSVAVIGIILGSGYLVTGTLIGIVLVSFIIIRDLKRNINPFKPLPENRKRKTKL